LQSLDPNLEVQTFDTFKNNYKLYLPKPQSSVLKKTCWYNMFHSGQFFPPTTKVYANVLGAQARLNNSETIPILISP